nr:MAG TPA: hypothetical protein [Caudoviricetes sp.]
MEGLRCSYIRTVGSNFMVFGRRKMKQILSDIFSK